ncbi:MAG: cytochrome c family protein [Hyphomicrobiales bacterium]|nr:cytochrome c family protein [Hyphomicrobiales bacterium]
MPLRRAYCLSVAAAIALIASPLSAAQNPERVTTGRLLAQSLCADCHTMGGATRSDRGPPDFAAIGAMPSMTALSIKVFLRSPHANMPDVQLDDQQIEALTAYILDLGGK